MTILQQSLGDLACRIGGGVLMAGDAGYDAARRVWNVMHDRRPLAIAGCTSAADVSAVIAFAVEHGLPLAVRGGGHSVVGFGTCEGGIVMDLRRMNAIEVDPVTRRVRAGGGATWGEFDAATQAHGLAVTGGRVSSTGIGGLTLGSGSGWLERKLGFTHDQLLSVEVVTASGELVRASPEEHTELFWGIRGGGGNFGVVTTFEFQAHKIGPTVLGGMLFSTKDHARRITRFMADYMVDAPEDLGAAMLFTVFPAEPFVPEALHGELAVGVFICWTGSDQEGQRIVAEIREAAEPVLDLVGPIAYSQLQAINDAPDRLAANMRAYMKAEYIEDLDDEAIDIVVRYFERMPSPISVLMLEPIGGAVDRVDAGDSALTRPKGRWCYHAMALWLDGSRESYAYNRAWAKGLAAEMEPHTTSGIFLTYTSDAVDDDRVRESFGPGVYERLVALKDLYDPGNLFSINQNIRPTAGVR